MKINIAYEMNSRQMRLREERASKQFSPQNSREVIISEIENAWDTEELEKIAMAEGMCDYCDFSSLKLKAAVSFMRVSLQVLYTFPKLRSHMNFIGSKAGFISTMQRLCGLDRDLINSFGVASICSDRMIVALADAGLSAVENTDYNGKENNMLASALSMGGFFDSIILDENDFRGLGYEALIKNLVRNEKNKYHPEGCDDPDYVFFHEYGHMLDYLTGFSSDRKFISYFKRFRKEDIADRLSVYAAESQQEFFAEAFAEYMCSRSPREMSVFSVKMFEAAYSEL